MTDKFHGKLHYGILTQADVDLMKTAMQIANRSVVARINYHSQPTPAGAAHPGPWLDTRPMLDPREKPEALIDELRAELQYALASGLMHRHPTEPHLVAPPEQV